jgi:hypothetical protein
LSRLKVCCGSSTLKQSSSLQYHYNQNMIATVVMPLLSHSSNPRSKDGLSGGSNFKEE